MSQQTRDFSAVIRRSLELAKERGRTPTVEDLLCAMVEHVDVESALVSLGVTREALLDEFRGAHGRVV